MAFDWKEYKEIARFLDRNSGVVPDEEAALRSAVSRFYYAAFGHAREYAVRHGFPRPGRGDNPHELVGNFFRTDTRYASTDIGANLRMLRQWRNACDYENNMPKGMKPKQLVSKADAYANAIIRAL